MDENYKAVAEHNYQLYVKERDENAQLRELTKVQLASIEALKDYIKTLGKVADMDTTKIKLTDEVSPSDCFMPTDSAINNTDIKNNHEAAINCLYYMIFIFESLANSLKGSIYDIQDIVRPFTTALSQRIETVREIKRTESDIERLKKRLKETENIKL